MSIGLRVGNKIDQMKSRRDENNDVNDYSRMIVECQDRIDENLMQIGQFYWNLYATDGSFNPPNDAKIYFDLVEKDVNDVQTYKKAIEDRRKSGTEEREKMDENVAAIEEQARTAKEEVHEARIAAREEAMAERQRAAETKKIEREAAAAKKEEERIARKAEREKAAEEKARLKEEAKKEKEADDGKTI